MGGWSTQPRCTHSLTHGVPHPRPPPAPAGTSGVPGRQRQQSSRRARPRAPPVPLPLHAAAAGREGRFRTSSRCRRQPTTRMGARGTAAVWEAARCAVHASHLQLASRLPPAPPPGRGLPPLRKSRQRQAPCQAAPLHMPCCLNVDAANEAANAKPNCAAHLALLPYCQPVIQGLCLVRTLRYTRGSAFGGGCTASRHAQNSMLVRSSAGVHALGGIACGRAAHPHRASPAHPAHIIPCRRRQPQLAGPKRPPKKP